MGTRPCAMRAVAEDACRHCSNVAFSRARAFESTPNSKRAREMDLTEAPIADRGLGSWGRVSPPLGLAHDKLEGFATRNSLTPGKPLSTWDFFDIHQLLGFPEDGLIDGKFLCLVHYKSKFASSAVGPDPRFIRVASDHILIDDFCRSENPPTYEAAREAKYTRRLLHLQQTAITVKRLARRKLPRKRPRACGYLERAPPRTDARVIVGAMLDVSDVVGRLGWYHAVLGAVTVLRAFPTAWTLLVVPFIVPPVEHWCAMPSLPSLQNWTQERWRLSALPVVRNGSDEQSVVLDGCNVHPLLDAESAVFDEENTVKCDSWTYNETVPGASAVPEWDLVCSNDWQRSLMQSVVFLGSLVGALIIGRLSDRFGRRFMFFTATFVYIVFGCAAAASPSASWYNSLRFFASVCIAGIQTTAAALL
ncbi:hypothetical protein HPB47_003820 [Ixodes persulcatus]|uniref:Uncharacterized protein n=1 Tax=Ixodes persulcatus TaxID=34615 RepID=A0AC60PHF7_IXOPE|nr:hypothetical protein HPB47_003820 [Ixodes persulcatus]